MSASPETLVSSVEAEADAPLHSLGFAEMDDTHAEFFALIQRLNQAQGEAFRELFFEMQLHTEMHFHKEHQRMKQTGCPAIAEHHAEHLRLLGELRHLRVRIEQGRIKLAQAFVREQLPAWFDTHLATLDSALAAHIKNRL